MFRTDAFYKQIGLNIKEARKAKGITYPQLAALTKLDKSGLSRIELGKTDTKIGTLKKIADALEIDIKDLL